MESGITEKSCIYKKRYRIFYAICLVLCFAVAICICVLGLPVCETPENYVVTFFSVGFFFAGRAVCYYEIYSSNTKTVETDYRDEMGGWTSTWDRKKLFAFGLANILNLQPPGIS